MDTISPLLYVLSPEMIFCAISAMSVGLCFVAEVATLHGGAASLANREGGGAIATLELPA